jgi:Protein of unknown function (DUF2892)
MVTNEGTLDRTFRVVVGLVLLSLFFVLEGSARYWALIGFVPLLTGLVGYCPLYSLLGFSTCASNQGRK